MVACTPNCLLPYQEGTDRPCDLGDVWCEFAEKVDANLVSLSEVVQRTVNIPMAVVSATELLTLAVGESSNLLFDQVLADTDDMVNLDVSQSAVFPRRPGTLYTYSLHIEAETTDAATELRSYAYVGDVTDLGGFGKGASTLSPYTIAVYMNNVVRSNGVDPLYFFVDAIGGAGVVTITSAVLSLAWTADE